MIENSIHQMGRVLAHEQDDCSRAIVQAVIIFHAE
jgi:hypothetical protein